MERVLDEIGFSAPDRSGETITIDAECIEKHIGGSGEERGLEQVYLIGAFGRS
jgi:ATP-dependent HslUV protease ATP-binding subunit HslU